MYNKYGYVFYKCMEVNSLIESSVAIILRFFIGSTEFWILELYNLFLTTTSLMWTNLILNYYSSRYYYEFELKKITRKMFQWMYKFECK